MKRLFLLLISISLLTLWTSAQEATPTPVGLVSLQGRDNTGLVQPLRIEEALVNTNVVPWRDADFTGSGVRVGVLDQGFGGLSVFEAITGASVTLVPGASYEEYTSSQTTHGTDVLYVINAFAPNAELYICSYLVFDQYVTCIDQMIVAGVQIINHSAGVPALPLDGSSRWSQEVDRAAEEGILWVNSAGNFARGAITDFFTDVDINGYHEFRGTGTNEVLGFEGLPQTEGRIMLSWDDFEDIPANQIDLALEVIDSQGRPIAISDALQEGIAGQSAIEIARIDMTRDFWVRVRINTDLDYSGRFVLFTEFTSLVNGNELETIIAPADSPNALAVGALQGNTIAPYSSRGPAGNIIKPNLVAPGELRLPSGQTFFGTSAAAPLVAGIAALVLEASPNLTRDQLFDFLSNSTQDDGEFLDEDMIYGRGRIFLGLPETALVSDLAPDDLIATLPGIGRDGGEIAANDDWIPYSDNFNSVEMMLVPRGCFQMGAFNPERPNELPIHEQCIEAPFWLDRTEVSNAQYGSYGYWSLPQQPREVVNWNDALAFCEERGARLPTEAEWEYAARGPDSLIYPWGNAFNADSVTYGNNSGRQTAFVGERPAGTSWVGAVDLLGNVWEWTSSASLPYPYARQAETTNAALRILRGASWLNGEATISTTMRVEVEPTFQLNNTGFRCARDFRPDELDIEAFLNRSAQAEEVVIALPTFNISAGVNLRAGPGTNYEVVGSARIGQKLPVVARANVEGFTWFRVFDLDNELKWVRSDFGELENVVESDLPLHTEGD